MVRLLVNYGDQTIKLESLNEKNEKEFEEVSVAVYIVDSINNDNISFEDKTYQKVFNFYAQKLDDEQLPTHQEFINNSDKAISQFVIDVFSVQHDLSPGWAQNKIFTTTESMQIKMAVVNSLFAFQLCKLTALIVKNQEELKLEKDSDKQMELLQEQVNLQQIKIQIADKLGRIILK